MRYREIKIQRYRDIEIQRYRDTEIERGIHSCRDSGKNRYGNVKLKRLIKYSNKELLRYNCYLYRDKER